MTQTLNASNVRSNWSQLLNKVFRGETEILVEKSGIPIAAIVSAEEYQKLQRIKRQRAKNSAAVAEIRAAFTDQTAEQINTGIETSIKEVRMKRKS